MSDGKERPWTPGPLHVVCTDDTAGALMIETLGGDPVAHVLTTAADAHRFAAAPDLYEALERAVAVLDSDELKSFFATAFAKGLIYTGPSVDMDAARAALSRATQEEET